MDHCWAFYYLHERVVSIQDTLAPASPPDRATPRASVAVLHVGLGEDAVHEVVAEPSRSPTPCTPPPQRPERSPGTKAAQKGAVRGHGLGMTPPGHLAPPAQGQGATGLCTALWAKPTYGRKSVRFRSTDLPRVGFS